MLHIKAAMTGLKTNNRNIIQRSAYSSLEFAYKNLRSLRNKFLSLIITYAFAITKPISSSTRYSLNGIVKIYLFIPSDTVIIIKIIFIKTSHALTLFSYSIDYLRYLLSPHFTFDVECLFWTCVKAFFYYFLLTTWQLTLQRRKGKS